MPLLVGSRRALLSRSLSIPLFVAIATVNNVGATTLVTIPLPAFANGDLLLATIAHGGVSSITPPTGWTLIRNTGSSSRTLSTWWKRADGTVGATAEWTLGASVTNIGTIASYRNVAMPPEVESGSNANSSSLTAPSITTLGARRMLVFGATANAQNITKPTEMTLRFALTNGAIAICVADELREADGATGTRVATTGSAALNAAQLAAFAPT